MIKINTSGDYVQLIYVDAVQESVQQELKSDTDAFECSYDSEGKLYMQFGLMRFENPDPTDFTINGSAVTDAADFIIKLNALFTGGGGGGSSLLPTSGTGTATDDVTGQLAGHDMYINDGINTCFYIVRDAANETIILNSQDNSSAGFAQLYLYSNSDSPAYQFFLQSFNTTNQVSLKGDAIANAITFMALKNIFPQLVGLDFMDDAAAASGGVDVAQLYHTAGAVKIRLS